VEGGKEHPMKDLEDIYMESVFPRNYNIKVVNEDYNHSVENELIKLKTFVIRIHKGLTVLKRKGLYVSIVETILKMLKKSREFSRINLRTDVEDEVKEYLRTATPIHIIADISQAFTQTITCIQVLRNFYENDNNEKMINTLNDLQSSLFDHALHQFDYILNDIKAKQR
jgi:hypothetical protein